MKKVKKNSFVLINFHIYPEVYFLEFSQTYSVSTSRILNKYFFKIHFKISLQLAVLATQRLLFSTHYLMNRQKQQLRMTSDKALHLVYSLLISMIIFGSNPLMSPLSLLKTLTMYPTYKQKRWIVSYHSVHLCHQLWPSERVQIHPRPRFVLFAAAFLEIPILDRAEIHILSVRNFFDYTRDIIGEKEWEHKISSTNLSTVTIPLRTAYVKQLYIKCFLLIQSFWIYSPKNPPTSYFLIRFMMFLSISEVVISN